MINSPIFIWIKNPLEFKIMIHILKTEWNYSDLKVKNNKVLTPQWFKINRLNKEVQIKFYYDAPSSSNNTITLKHLNKWGPFTNEECRIKKINQIMDDN
jgi:hypothetical protein